MSNKYYNSDVLQKYLVEEYNADWEDVSDIERPSTINNSGWGGIYDTKFGTFQVVNYDDAEKDFEDDAKRVWEEAGGIEAYDVNYIIPYVDEYYFKQYFDADMEAEAESYYYDKSDKFANGMIELLYENKVLKDNDFLLMKDTAEGKSYDYKKCRLSEEDITDKFYDFMYKDIDKDFDYISWFIDYYGEEEFMAVCKQRDLVDTSDLIDEYIESQRDAFEEEGDAFKYEDEWFMIYKLD